MRIIAGKFRGRLIHPPKGLTLRPTTDMAKEALFNILANRLEFEGLRVLDCFAGTGSISYEFLSRGVASVVAVESDPRCLAFIRSTFIQLGFLNATTIKMPVGKYLAGKPQPFDLIFMDPPYAMQGQEALVLRCLEGGWLSDEGLLVIEHSSHSDFSHLPGFGEVRKYGGSSFSFFERDLPHESKENKS